MTKRRNRIVCWATASLLAIVASAPALAAPLSIEGLSVMGAGPNGESVGYSYGENSTGGITNDQGEVSVDAAFFAVGGLSASPTYVNTSLTPNVGFSLSSPGLYTFTLYYSGGIAGSDRAINLFFGSSVSPGISVWAHSGETIFNANGESNLVRLSGPSSQYVNGSGSVFYDDGIQTVTMTALHITAPYSDASPIGARSVSEGNQTNVEAATFVLNVTADTAIPEPATMSLLGVGLMGLHLVRGRKARTTI